MQCGKCGEPVPGGAHFCGSCGARIDAPAPLLGQTIAGRYRLVRQVGEGGMGSVFEAEQTLGSSQRAVAIKLLRPEWSHDPAVKARFHREAATVARLEHFNTVRVYDFGATDDGTLFIVMEFLQGRSLQQLLDQGGALPPERVEHIAQQIAASLEEAHGLGIVHRDLKPDNILLIENYASQRDVVKIVDFGIAKGQPAVGAPTTKLTELGAFVGTPAYMSPEQFSPGGVGPESDIYSLGLTTYQMLAGHLPFAAQTTLEWVYAHTSKPPQPLDDQYGAGPIPEAMRHAVLRALSKDPAQRQTTATMFSHELSGRTVRELQPVAASAASAPLGVSSAVAGSAVAGSAAAGSAAASSAGQAPAPAAAFEPARAEPNAGAPAVGGGPRTAPMMQFPDLGAAPPGRPPTTQPMAAVPDTAPRRQPAFGGVPAAPPVEERSRPGRALLWATVALGGTTTVLLLAWAVWNQGLLPWPQLGGTPDVAPPPLVVPASGSPAEPEPAPSEPDPVPEATRPQPAPPKEPSAPRPTPRPPVKPTTPEPTPASPTPAPTSPLPTSPLPLPGLPGQPVPTVPGQPTPGTPEPAPGTTPPPGVPQLPWSLPTAGSCERCLQALQAGGNYAVVTAVGESLLCEDRTARATCEKQIDEQAPAVAERAARAGDCPAAIATVAAAVNVRVSPDRFRNIDALCGLR